MQAYKICVVLFLSSICCVNAQQAISLAEAIEIGLENNFQIAIEKKNLLIAQNNDDWAMAGRAPSVDATLTGNGNYSNSENAFSTTNSVSLGLTPAISARMTLYGGHQIKLTKAQMEQVAAQSQVNVAQAIETVTRDITDRYLNAQFQKSQLHVLRQVQNLSRDRIMYEEVKKEFGQSVRFDYLNAQNAYLSDSINFVRQKNIYENALKALQLAIQAEQQPTDVTDSLFFNADQWSEETLVDELLANNKNLQQLQLAKEINIINADIQRALDRPRVQLGADLSLNNQRFVWGEQQIFGGEPNDLSDLSLSSRSAGLSVTATYNIFDGGVQKKNIQNALVQAEISALQAEQTEVQLRNQLQQLHQLYQAQIELAEISLAAEAIAAENLTIAEERFKGGLINSFDYRNVQLAYANASLAKINTIFNMETTRNEVNTLVGKY